MNKVIELKYVRTRAAAEGRRHSLWLYTLCEPHVDATCPSQDDTTQSYTEILFQHFMYSISSTVIHLGVYCFQPALVVFK